MPIPALTAQQMREVDRLAVEVYSIGLPQMMELAGRATADLAARLAGSSPGRRILVAAGRGNNGGGGLVTARHLANRGASVTVVVERVDALHGVPRQQLQAARTAGADIVEGDEALAAVHPGAADLAIDALIGYGLRGAPAGWTADVIRRLNGSGIPVLSLDVPSGLDATSGDCADPCIQATATLTLALPKTGLLTPTGRSAAGTLYLADIGLPPRLYAELGLEVGPLFSREAVIMVDLGGSAIRA